MVRAGKWTGGTSTPGQQTGFALAAAGHATVTEITAMMSVRFRVRRPITMRMAVSLDFYSSIWPLADCPWIGAAVIMKAAVDTGYLA